ncbi:hypothetical protein Agabi119p4_3310 [Agaricus bisporus var. burnettii]|uniref:Uncharacterized protein n=1 Tax=Agaricus bisporus var. burnettii TaxID=192524 RepID=A0A8H7F781_AGABI|nr:hypothetical protein Agabi119p4_3310 [Agaricus bisporus var. burnettii]
MSTFTLATFSNSLQRQSSSSPPRAHKRLQHLRTPLNSGGLRDLQDQGNSLGLRFVVRIPYLTRIPKVYALVMRILDVGERGLTWNMFSWSMSTVPSEPIPLIDQVEKVESAMISISFRWWENLPEA